MSDSSATGSANISRATQEWSEVLEEARQRYDGYEPLIHIAYSIVNEQVRAGIPWNKCPNCGSPYRTDREGCSGTLCSERCDDEYRVYLREELG